MQSIPFSPAVSDRRSPATTPPPASGVMPPNPPAPRYRILAAWLIGIAAATSPFTEGLAQHDPGRNAVRLLADGNYEGAAKELERSRSNNSPVNEAEKHFVRAMSAGLQNDPGTALQEARRAVELGIPFQRIAAGPADAFAPLFESTAYADWADQYDTRLLHGPMIGHVTAETALVWMRTHVPGEVIVEVQGPRSMYAQRVTTSLKTDRTAVAQITGLTPLTDYTITLQIAGKIVGQGHLRTTAPNGTPDQFSVIFGGGAGFTPEYERMWSTIEERSPNALFLLGDNVYIDDPTHSLTHHYCYYRRQSQPEWRSLVAGTPVYAIYDDHDFGLNDCIPGPFIDKPEWKRSVFEIFRNNWVNPAYGGGDPQPGCWFDMMIADVHFIFPDCRFYRDRAGRTMLGPVQKAWLKETLQQSRGTFKVIASTVPWSAGVKPGSRDTWDGYTEEREEIFAFTEEQGLEGVILLAADRHRVDIRRTPRSSGYDLYEFMSSRLTNVHTHGLVQNAAGSEFITGYNKTPAFAQLNFNTTANPPEVRCDIIDINGQSHGQFSVTLDQLRHAQQ